jgi:hypothetical protein
MDLSELLRKGVVGVLVMEFRFKSRLLQGVFAALLNVVLIGTSNLICSPIVRGESLEFSISRYRSGDLSGAERAVISHLRGTRALQDQSQGLKLLGIIRFTKGEIRKSESHFKEALSIDPNLVISTSETLDQRVIPFFDKIKVKVNRNLTISTANPPKRAQSALRPKSIVKSTLIRIHTTPVSAKVMIDGIFAGSSEQLLSVVPGSFSVELIADGYEIERRSIRIAQGETRTLNIPLRRKQEPVLSVINSAPTLPSKDSNSRVSERKNGKIYSNGVGKQVDGAEDLFAEQSPARQFGRISPAYSADSNQMTDFDRDLASEKSRLKRVSEARKMVRIHSVPPRQDTIEEPRIQPGTVVATPTAESGENSMFYRKDQYETASAPSKTPIIPSTGELYAPSVDNEVISYPTNNPNQGAILNRPYGGENSQPQSRINGNGSRPQQSSYQPKIGQEQYRYTVANSSPPQVYILADQAIPDPANKREKAKSEPGFPTVLPFGIGQMYQKRYVEGSILLVLQSGLLFLAIDRNLQADSRELDLEKFVGLNCSPSQTLQDRVYKNCLTYLEREYQGIDKLRNESYYASLGLGVVALGGVIEALIWEPRPKSLKKSKSDGVKSRRSRQRYSSNLWDKSEEERDPIEQRSFYIQPQLISQNKPVLGINASYSF